MKFFRYIFFLFEAKDKHPYVTLKREVEVLAPFLIDRKIEHIHLLHFIESNLKEYNIFKLGNDFVLYFDRNRDNQTDLYIRENYLVIRERLKSKRRNFACFYFFNRESESRNYLNTE